jgi:hypothetical protein
MKNFLIKASFWTNIGIAALCLTSNAKAQENIALHRPVTLVPKATAAPGNSADPAQLTDGIYASTSGAWNTKNHQLPLWQQAGTLQWRVKGKAIITIDLGSVQPISGVIFSTAGGGESKEGWGITWPQSIYIATSDDNKTWHYVGDLVQLSQKNGTPPVKGDVVFRYIVRDLKTHGRYVSLGVVGYPYILADEVEVLRGADALLDLPAGTPTQSMEEFVLRNQITGKAKQRQLQDIAAIRTLLKKATIPNTLKSTFETELAEDAALTQKMSLQPADFKTIIPLSDVHRDILAVHGKALAAQGFKPLTIWKKHRYASLDLINVPQRKTSIELNITALKNEFRSDSILLTNASDQPMKITVTAPKVLSGGLELSHAIWTDTVYNLPVQSALIPLKNDGGTYSFEIPAGITGKLWATIDTSKIPAGNYKSTFTISGGGQTTEVSITVNIANTAMPRPRLSLVMWDGTVSQSLITPNNMHAAIDMMAAHFVDTPETSHSRIFGSTPKESDFDANNQLKPNATIDFRKFDAWLKQWPKARHYLIYHPVGANYIFAGAKMGTPEFNARYGNYIKAIANHAKTLGVQPSQLLFCFKDETHDDESDRVVINMATAVKSVVPEVTVFSNPQWANPAEAKDQRAFTLPDILCISAKADTMDFYEKLHRDHDTKLWFYTTPPGVHALDPQNFYRAYAWMTYAMNGSGMGWWSFADARAETSWNAYNTAFGGYAPAFLDGDHVYSSVHWEAVREGVEDFELLSMLSDNIKKSNDSDAQTILNNAVAVVTATYSKSSWRNQSNPQLIDEQIAKVRTLLSKSAN